MGSHRALVADDDADVLSVVSEAIASLGFDVKSVENGGALIDCLASDGPFDLIVTDVSMPWMDSLKTLRSIRTAGVTTPVIVMTALTDEQIPTRVQALGANAILLRKPFGLDELTSARSAAGATPLTRRPIVNPRSESVHPLVQAEVGDASGDGAGVDEDRRVEVREDRPA